MNIYICMCLCVFVPVLVVTDRQACKERVYAYQGNVANMPRLVWVAKCWSASGPVNERLHSYYHKPLIAMLFARDGRLLQRASQIAEQFSKNISYIAHFSEKLFANVHTYNPYNSESISYARLCKIKTCC